MGYFTETMEALSEFKSDIALDNADRRNYEIASGKTGHDSSYNAKVNRASRMMKNSVQKPAKNMDDYRKRSEAGNDLANYAGSLQKTNQNRRDIYSGGLNRHSKKSYKESVSEGFSKAFEEAIMQRE